jgi:ABC-type lipoprotein release transport system permease subunit
LRPFELFVGLRYTRAKRRTHFISFISFISIAGIALGIAAAAALTRITTAMLFEISASDPLTFAAISLLLFIVALAAAAIPACRAMRIDPLVALKAE